MNMILHDCPTAEIWRDNTLSSPYFKQGNNIKTFDFGVANPPFSNKAWRTGFDPDHDAYGRFAYGIPPTKNGDYAFLLHLLTSLKSHGKGAIILPHGVLFRGGSEAEIRKNLVRRGFIKGVIGLPANLFYGTGIPACIIVLDKENAQARTGVYMVDASKGFRKDGNKNRLRAQDIHKIVDAFTRQLEIDKYARLVPTAEIEANDSTEPEDLQDIEAHLRGGILDRDVDDLGRYWQVFPGLRAGLFEPADRPGYSQLKVAISDIKVTIFGHPEFTAFQQAVGARFAEWRAANTPILKDITMGDHPKVLIENLSEGLLEAFKPAPLIEAYDVYQHLMDYWDQTMQDDVYLLVQEGWQAVVDGKPNTDLIPAPLVINRYFAAEARAPEDLEAQREAITRQMDELDEEHGGEEGLLAAEARTDKGALTKASLKARLTEIKQDPEAAEEKKLLQDYLDLMEQETAAKKRLKEAQKALEAKVAAQYGKLTEDEVKDLVVDNKWLAALAAAVQTELDRVSQALTGRVRQLAERYAEPLPRLAEEVQALAVLVNEHLQKMGAVWN
jgi:type I restriction enzyme M protein